MPGKHCLQSLCNQFHVWLRCSGARLGLLWTGTGNSLNSFFEEPSQNRSRRFSVTHYYICPDIEFLARASSYAIGSQNGALLPIATSRKTLTPPSIAPLSKRTIPVSSFTAARGSWHAKRAQNAPLTRAQRPPILQTGWLKSLSLANGTRARRQWLYLLGQFCEQRVGQFL